jgi:chromosome segregation ATPase
MARGWESKSVEEQMAEKQEDASDVKTKDAERERKRRDLEMQREYLLNQRTSNANRRAALAEALEQIEASLRELG